MLYRQSNKETKSEGFVISKISVRLTSDRFQKLNELLDKMGVEALKNGDDVSDKLRKFIDTLHSQLVVSNSQVITQKPHTRKCYMSDYATVSVKEVCEACRIRTPKAFLNCPEVNKEHGIEVKR